MKPALLASTTVLLTALSGCSVAPTVRGAPEPFSREKLEFLRVGESTRDAVQARMTAFPLSTQDGETRINLEPMQFHDGLLWLYAMAEGEGGWQPLGSPDAGNPGGSSAVAVASQDFRYLRILFNHNDVLAGYEVSRSGGKGCNVQGVCANGPAYMLLVSGSVDRATKRFRPPDGQCGIYFYAGSIKQAAPVWLDYKREGWLIDKKTYLYWAVESGTHRLSSQTPDGRFKPYLPIECEGGGLHFVELRQAGGSAGKTLYRQTPSAHAGQPFSRCGAERGLGLTFSLWWVGIHRPEVLVQPVEDIAHVVGLGRDMVGGVDV
jgi:hypothetical protein